MCCLGARGGGGGGSQNFIGESSLIPLSVSFLVQFTQPAYYVKKDYQSKIIWFCSCDASIVECEGGESCSMPALDLWSKIVIILHYLLWWQKKKTKKNKQTKKKNKQTKKKKRLSTRILTRLVRGVEDRTPDSYYPSLRLINYCMLKVSVLVASFQTV